MFFLLNLYHKAPNQFIEDSVGKKQQETNIKYSEDGK